MGVMIPRTPRITVRDREVGRDVVSREARDEPGSREFYLGRAGRVRRGHTYDGTRQGAVAYLWRTCVTV